MSAIRKSQKKVVNLPSEVQKFIGIFKSAGFECFAVGGSVRDLHLGRQTSESRRWDFTTNARPEEIQKLFPDSFYNNTFGTVGVKIATSVGEEIFEVTTFRKEGKYTDRRHPDEIAWGDTIGEDLARRDFTINAMATDGSNLVDPYNGQGDLEKKMIRTVGIPDDRISEDALRMMRAIRFATQLAFTIDQELLAAIKKNAKYLLGISSERIRDELVKILASDYPADGIQLLLNTGLLALILPELTAGAGMRQPGHHIHDVLTHSIEALRFCKNPTWVVRLATLLHDVGKPATYRERDGKPTFYNHEIVGAAIARKIAERLHLSREDREKIYSLVRWHMFSVSELITDAAVRRFIQRVGKENTAEMLDLRIGDRLGSGSRESSWRLEKFKARIVQVQQHIPSVTDLAVNGKDVMEVLKIGPGPRVGQILNSLFEEIMDDPTKNSREFLLNRILELAKN